MDQIGSALIPAPDPTDRLATARVKIAPLALVSIPDAAFSLMWLEQDAPFDHVITRRFEPVQLI